ncbi:MAG: hypothetical protein FWC26_10945 [Fibromonadales bacterium]|nr:hypothetical protein [Fibromonadales bacterium]
MEIVIHGTKGGYKVLHETSQKLLFSWRGDVRRIDVINSRDTVGQSAYSIAFADNGCVFSKYIGIWDVERNAIGNIIFSAFIPNSKRLAGNYVKRLLDDIAGTYQHEYITNGNLSNKHEDWVLFTTIVKQFEKYEQQVSPDSIENIQSDTAEAAFIYYSSEEELKKYFDIPYQEEYSAFKQVFFVEKKLEGKPENPLNALKHDFSKNFTGRIDLENPKYTLYFSEKVKVEKDDFICKNRGKVHRKGIFKISYSKPYHVTEAVVGTVEEIKDYVIVNDDARTIFINENNCPVLKPMEYSFKFIALYQGSRVISDAKVMLEEGFAKAEELPGKAFTATYEKSKMCMVYATKGLDLISEKLDLSRKIVNEDISAIDVRLDLKERFKEISIIVKEECSGKNIRDFKIFQNGKPVQLSYSDMIKFPESEINERIRISARSHGYEDLEITIVPAKTSEIEFELRRKKAIPAWDDGKKSSSSSSVSRDKLIIFGLTFLLAILSAVISVWAWKNSEQPSDKDLAYLNGIELFKPKLDENKKKFCKKNGSDTTEYCVKLDNAIAIRGAIYNGDIQALKEIKTYSKEQQLFAIEINNIKDAPTIGDSLKKNKKDSSLYEIATYIKQVQTDLTTKHEEEAAAKKQQEVAAAAAAAEKKRRQEEAETKKQQKPSLSSAPAPNGSSQTGNANATESTKADAAFLAIVKTGDKSKNSYNAVICPQDSKCAVFKECFLREDCFNAFNAVHTVSRDGQMGLMDVKSLADLKKLINNNGGGIK